MKTMKMMMSPRKMMASGKMLQKGMGPSMMDSSSKSKKPSKSSSKRSRKKKY